MRHALTFRGLILRALLTGLLAGSSGGVFAQYRAAPMVRRSPQFRSAAAGFYPAFREQGLRPAPIERRAAPAARPGAQLVRPDGRRGGEHLAEWMNQHSGMTLQQQQQELDREPGFRELPPQTQQRMHQHLAQLNAMPPQHRARILALNEAMERLSLEQRSEVRGAMQQLGSLPPDQRHMVAHSFRELRLLPPDQRMATLNSGRYSWMNEAQRTTLINLLRVEPMLPPPEPQQPR